MAMIASHISSALAAEGVVTVKSELSVKETIDRYETVVKSNGMAVFLRVDHAAGAGKVGKELRPTELLVFGNPQSGTALMQCAQSAGIDLPLKVLAWQDAAGQVWLGYNDPAYLVKRHDIGATCAATIEAISKAMRSFSGTATHR